MYNAYENEWIIILMQCATCRSVLPLFKRWRNFEAFLLFLLIQSLVTKWVNFCEFHDQCCQCWQNNVCQMKLEKKLSNFTPESCSSIGYHRLRKKKANWNEVRWTENVILKMLRTWDDCTSSNEGILILLLCCYLQRKLCHRVLQFVKFTKQLKC